MRTYSYVFLRLSLGQILNSLLPRPLEYNLRVLAHVLWSWLPCAHCIAAVVPKYDINTEIMVELEPLPRVLLELCKAQIWIANYHGARSAYLRSVDVLEAV